MDTLSIYLSTDLEETENYLLQRKHAHFLQVPLVYRGCWMVPYLLSGEIYLRLQKGQRMELSI
jgi:hypothetical protein